MPDWRRLAALAFPLFLTGCVAARAETAAEFFAGRTVTIYVGFGPGGGYDVYAQLLARFIPAHLPGQPAVIVKHMPGADSMVLMNWLANIAPRDGTAFGIVASGVPVVPLIGQVEQKNIARFDARKLGWLGSLEKFNAIAIAWHTAGFRTLDDVKTRELRFASTGPASGGEVYAKMLNETIGTKFRAIRGYRSSPELTLAMERGEVDGMVGWCWACMRADKPDYLDKGLVTPLAQFGLAPEPGTESVPTAIDLVQSPAEKQIFSLIFGALAMSRPFVAPQDVPAERLAALRAAFEATARDPAFLEAAKKAGRDIIVFRGAEIDALLAEQYALPADVVRRATELSAP